MADYWGSDVYENGGVISFKNLRKDHELHSIVDNVQLVDYWQKFSLTTRKIINKYQNYIPWGIDSLYQTSN